MNSRDIISVLRAHRSDLKRQGVVHVALFGSVARGDDGPSSDIDIMIDVDPSAPMTVYDYVALKEYISGLLDAPVDVVHRSGLKPHIAEFSLQDAIHAF